MWLHGLRSPLDIPGWFDLENHFNIPFPSQGFADLQLSFCPMMILASYLFLLNSFLCFLQYFFPFMRRLFTLSHQAFSAVRDMELCAKEVKRLDFQSISLIGSVWWHSDDHEYLSGGVKKRHLRAASADVLTLSVSLWRQDNEGEL